jgi:hypothetical protein
MFAASAIKITGNVIKVKGLNILEKQWSVSKLEVPMRSKNV